MQQLFLLARQESGETDNYREILTFNLIQDGT